MEKWRSYNHINAFHSLPFWEEKNSNILWSSFLWEQVFNCGHPPFLRVTLEMLLLLNPEVTYEIWFRKTHRSSHSFIFSIIFGDQVQITTCPVPHLWRWIMSSCLWTMSNAHKFKTLRAHSDLLRGSRVQAHRLYVRLSTTGCSKTARLASVSWMNLRAQKQARYLTTRSWSWINMEVHPSTKTEMQ